APSGLVFILPGPARPTGRRRPLPGGGPPPLRVRPDGLARARSGGRAVARLPRALRLARLAGETRPLRGQGRTRLRGDGRGAQGVRPGPESERRDQGDVRLAGILRRGAATVPPRGEGGGV